MKIKKRWTTDKRWYRPYLPEDMRTAYLVNKAELDTFNQVLQQHDDIQQVYETDRYVIFGAEKNYTYLDE